MKAAFSVLSIVVLSLSTIPSCDKSVAKEPVDEHLTGSWVWIRTDGGIANNIHETPASTGKQKTLILNGNYTYKIVINNVTASEGNFTIESKQCMHDGQSKPYIQFKNAEALMVERADSTVLILSDEAADGVNSEYHLSGTTVPG
jgi:hypothetical protein